MTCGVSGTAALKTILVWTAIVLLRAVRTVIEAVHSTRSQVVTEIPLHVVPGVARTILIPELRAWTQGGPAVGSIVGSVMGSVMGAIMRSIVGSIVGPFVGSVMRSMVGPIMRSVMGPMVRSMRATFRGGTPEAPGPAWTVLALGRERPILGLGGMRSSAPLVRAVAEVRVGPSLHTCTTREGEVGMELKPTCLRQEIHHEDNYFKLKSR